MAQVATAETPNWANGVRLQCHLRRIRGNRPLRDLEEHTGIHRGTLSKIEHGRLLPTDDQIPVLETAYDTPRTEWYGDWATLAIQPDEDSP